jgi:hypothetical protein
MQALAQSRPQSKNRKMSCRESAGKHSLLPLGAANELTWGLLPEIWLGPLSGAADEIAGVCMYLKLLSKC